MIASFSRRYQVLTLAAGLVAVVIAVYLTVPLLLNAYAFKDAEKMSYRWILGLSKQFDLPGTPPDYNDDEDGLLDRLLFPKQDFSAVSREVDLFDPARFEQGAHVVSLRGYTVFTQFGQRFVSGGRPVHRDLRSVRIAEAVDKVMRSGVSLSFLNSHEHAGSDRIVTVVFPLLKWGRPHAVAVVDVERTTLERQLFGVIQGAVTISAALMTLIALGILMGLSYLDARRRSAESEASFLAMHDTLTGLANRRQFNAVFAAALSEAERSTGRLALICVDVDDFKEVNDVFGHPAGDRLLSGIADLLKAQAGEAGLAARLSGDEFAIILPDAGSDRDPHGVGTAILDALREPFRIDGQRITVSVSIGFAVYPEHGLDAEALNRRADLALYRAKADGRGCCRAFQYDMESRIRRKRRLHNDLERAVLSGDLELHYQPQIDIGSGSVIGFEALMRWTHPKEGPIPPSEFIPLAEESGTINMLGKWSIRTACLEAAAWPEPVIVAVNLSPVQLESGTLVADVREALEHSGLDPARLELEMTEGSLLSDTETVIESLADLRALGVGIAVDDFGTGYSSLSYLTRVPLTKIKIDRRFVEQLEADRHVEAIVQAIMGIGGSLGVKILAEGVETFDQKTKLDDLGCSLVQGFLYGRPEPNPYGKHSIVATALSDVQRRLAG